MDESSENKRNKNNHQNRNWICLQEIRSLLEQVDLIFFQ